MKSLFGTRSLKRFGKLTGFLGISCVAISLAFPWTAIYGDWVTGWDLIRLWFRDAVPWLLGLWPLAVGTGAFVAFLTSCQASAQREWLQVLALGSATLVEAILLTMISAVSYGGVNRVVYGAGIVIMGLVGLWASLASGWVERAINGNART